MSKKEALQKFHKNTIASAADRLFQENGIDKTTMDDIARESDYSKATLYVYFKSKDEIFSFIVLKYMKLLAEKIHLGVNSSQKVLQQYKAICDELTSFGDQYPDYYHFLTATIAVDKKSRLEIPVLEEIYQIGEANNTCIASVLESGIQQGYFREGLEILPTVFLLWASISSIIQLAHNKTEYIRFRMGMQKDVFLAYCFDTLLRTILKEGVNPGE